MKASLLKYTWAIFGVGMILGFRANAQQVSGMYQPKQRVENRYSNSSIILASDIHSLWDVKPSPAIINTYPYQMDFSDQITPIDGPLTPKDAVFCQFENRLWKSFDIGIRLRVETPMPLH